jgi:hypothetical protein
MESIKSWWLHCPGGGKGESEDVEVVCLECMVSRPHGGRLAIHLHGTVSSKVVELTLDTYIYPPTPLVAVHTHPLRRFQCKVPVQ